MDLENNEIFTIVEEEVQKMGFFQRIASLFVSPVRLMQNIKYYPAIASMLFFVMALSLFTMPFMDAMTEITNNKMSEIMLTRYGQDFLNFMDSAQSTANTGATSIITTITTIIALIVVYPIMCFLKALVLFIITKIARRGEARYVQYASMYAHVLVITVIGSLITTAIMVATDTLLDASSLAAIFMPNGDISMMSYNLLSSITLFKIVETILMFIGVKEINSFSTTKAVAIVSVMFVLTAIFTAVIAGSSLLILDMSYKALGF